MHAIPPQIAPHIEGSSPPRPRDANPIKLSFEVDDLELALKRLVSSGVPVIERPWGAYDGVDPEGNIFGIIAAPSA